ncbi:MAG TPA: hypothetical protein VE866_05570 [Candidatus Binatia bacterium]|jgi:hypothetical protein|nr:hypothetical protein [Candidatus Binatia bacterium]
MERKIFAGVVLVCGLGLIVGSSLKERNKQAEHGRAVQMIAADKMNPSVFQEHCGQAHLRKNGANLILSYPARDIDVVFDPASVTYLSTSPARVIDLDEAVTRLSCKP